MRIACARRLQFDTFLGLSIVGLVSLIYMEVHMARKSIVQIGDNGCSILFKKTAKVIRFDSSLWSLVRDLKETLEPRGLGLSAPQILEGEVYA